MFWGLVLEPGKKYAQTVDKPFHISMASLDVAHSENELVSVNVNFQNAEFILCNLQKHKVFQTSLDLNFMAGDKIAFYTTGKGRVHLTGYLIEDEDDDDDDDDLGAVPEDEDSDEEQVVNDVSKQKTPVQGNKQEKRKSAGQTPGRPAVKRSKMESEDEDEEEEEDDDSDVEGLEDSDGDVEMESGDEDEAEEEDDDEEDDEEDESDESEDTTPQKQQPQGKNKEKQQSAQKQQQQNKQLHTPNEMKKKKDKTPGATTPNTPSIQANGGPETQSGKKNKKKGGESPGDSKGSQTPKTAPGGSPGQTPQKKVLEGGVAVEDTVIGSGQIAKPGRFVTVYYTGRLKQNNKKFDETVQGPGFKFRLGKGEVIKGWDIGLSGMKVGGKRKLTIPPHMAYGAKGSPPVIPPNSALVFEVELRNVN